MVEVRANEMKVQTAAPNAPHATDGESACIYISEGAAANAERYLFL